MMEPTATRTEHANRLAKLVHEYPGTDQELIDDLKSKYLRTDRQGDYPDYQGEPNEDLDEPVTIHEIKAELANITKNTAPGPDLITARTLYNLGDADIEALVDHFNQNYWIPGALPQQWKTADIRFIPKPGKDLKVDNLRPISLTSCLGKIFERVINTRLQRFLDQTNQLPHTQFGFRPHLCTADVLLQVYRDVYLHPDRTQPCAVLALDLKGAFDNVLHSAVLRTLAETNCGSRTYNYIRAFLQDRKARFNIGGIKSDLMDLGSRGTPQGAVLSPLLFNLVMKDLPPRLDQVPGIRHALYADDITIWSNQGTRADIEDSFQRAIEIVQTYARSRGLECAPDKSELLVVQPQKPKYPKQDPIKLHVDFIPIFNRQEIRVLGVHFSNKAHNTTAVSRLISAANQVALMIRRVTSKNHGMKETDTIKLVQAFVVSRYTYVAPFLNLKPNEEDRLDRALRKCIKLSLGLPVSTSNERLMALGIHNTTREIVDAQRIAQQVRLTRTETGRAILRRLDITPPTAVQDRFDIPREIRARIHVRPLPRHMHPEHDQVRRTLRAQYLSKTWDSNPATIYVDAAGPNNGVTTAAACSSSGRPIATASIKTVDPTRAEEVAIALAISAHPRAIIMTDCQEACRNFSRGRVCRQALRIIAHHPPEGAQIIWFPGHQGQTGGNVAAHALARDSLSRAFTPAGCPLDTGAIRSPSPPSLRTTYREILLEQRLGRRRFPAPHPSLTRTEEVLLRQLHTNTLPVPATLHKYYPSIYPTPQCPHCDHTGDLLHTMWYCTQNPNMKNITPNNRSTAQWEATLLNPHPACQKWLADRAARATRRPTEAPD